MVKKQTPSAPMVGEPDEGSPDVQTQILTELKVLNLRQQEQVLQLKAMDWKLWVLMNSVVDALMKAGTLEEDPRTK